MTVNKEERLLNNYFDGLEVSTVHKILFFIIMMAYFFEQMDNWNFGFIAPALMKSWSLTMVDVSKITFAYFMAMTLGGLTGGIISDFIGRRKTFQIWEPDALKAHEAALREQVVRKDISLSQIVAKASRGAASRSGEGA